MTSRQSSELAETFEAAPERLQCVDEIREVCGKTKQPELLQNIQILRISEDIGENHLSRAVPQQRRLKEFMLRVGPEGVEPTFEGIRLRGIAETLKSIKSGSITRCNGDRDANENR